MVVCTSVPVMGSNILDGTACHLQPWEKKVEQKYFDCKSTVCFGIFDHL